MYFLYTTGGSDSAPLTISAALESIQSTLNGRNLLEMLDEVASTIERVISRGQAQDPIDLDDELDDDLDDELLLEEQDEEEEEEDDDQLWSPKSPQHQSPAFHGDNTSRNSWFTSSTISRSRIRSDIRAAKRAGFKVGVLGNLNAGGFMCISIRVVKLGISEEAMQAWGLQRKHYLILMIRFEQGYRTLEQVSEEGASAGKNKTEMRVALSMRYKPTITDALNAFTQVPKAASKISSAFSASHEARHSSLETVFIGRPLNDLLRERFSGITKYRLACAFSWTGSETFFNDVQGKSVNCIDSTLRQYSVADESANRALPSIVTADHIGETMGSRALSLPLVAMQFVLRHFVRCTEFCLVCHCRIDATFEALKPYVCSKPLCLYQYMTLGFGPTIEWEILTQPDVVDLLVSFCYTGAKHKRLREFPVGIDLRVPGSVLVQNPYPGAQHSGYGLSPALKSSSEDTSMALAEPSHTTFDTRLDAQKMELVFTDRTEPCPVRVGDWVVLESKALNGQTHTRVVETVFWPVVKLQWNGICVSDTHLAWNDRPSRPDKDESTPATTPRLVPAGLVETKIYVYDLSFDEISDAEKQQAIVTLLDTLPSVTDMKFHLLEKQHSQDPTLKTWREGISESALNLLRWIIASNRSCIVQVDRHSSALPKDVPDLPAQSQSKSEIEPAIGGVEDRVSGMASWMQFRFAQGAPDKEQRFIDCVNEVSAQTRKAHPTIFAWHGSPLSNWHSIVRQGLNYNETLHGRAFGHGVYMSPQCNTSIGYSNQGGYQSSGTSVWPNSRLRISCALSLNEVVNAPDQFTSKTPHYVVQNIDWIQTRYLFIKADHKNLGHTFSIDKMPSATYEQDPQALAIGESGGAVVIPITAVSKSRRPAVGAAAQSKTSSKKAKSMMVTNQKLAEEAEDDAASLVTDTEDEELVLSSDEDEPMPLSQPIKPTSSFQADTFRASKRRAPEQSKTDFVAGTLDLTKLKLFKPPSDASTNTTRTLMKMLRETLKVQETTPAHELGWYVHGDDLDNVYQWIVELHSFESTLPLAKDMKSAGMTSVVLELRFTNQFPFSPPFVRVIRPRFMSFAAGGGGHVTIGGALCMELLTNNGWLLSTSIENVLLQVRMAMSSTEPRPARLEKGLSHASYGVGEAIDAYKRACQMHGWTAPKDIDSLRQD